ncbi:MAG TPA: low molecular weight protein-tyrosine-phosphatase [Mycobacteriales bacterium]|nr:low molecular weight protein-tyrosine-phosphatase [Pseudonocardia sp.]HWH28262.1 low molecular weight protein-tyrosine-phosphatase [Mycobacteriales bacterium]
MTAPDQRLRICFVCTGNICRSPIAEKVLVHELARAGLAEAAQVSSAGTGGWHAGGPADHRAAALLRAEGYPHAHVARRLDAELLSADLLVALDREHLRALRRLVPEPERVRLLRSFDPDAPQGAEVPDPYYGDEAGFAEVLAMVRAAVPGLLDWVRGQLRAQRQSSSR